MALGSLPSLHLFELSLALGIAIGFISGVLGIGGGLIAIPLLGGLLHVTEQTAQGTSVIMVVSNLLVGVVNYHKRRAIDLRFAIRGGLTALPGALVGSYIAITVPSRDLRIGFALFLLVLSLETLRRNRRIRSSTIANLETDSRPISSLQATLIGAIAGFVSGLFGVGGALLSVPILTFGFRFTQMRAQGSSLLVVLPSVLVNAFVYGAAHDILWITSATLAIGGLIMVPLGVAFASGLPERNLKFIFSAFLFASSVMLLTQR